MKFLAFAALFAIISICGTNAATDMVFGYFGSWAIYRQGLAQFAVQDIDATKYSHLTYAFIGLNEDGTIKILDEWADVHLGGFRKFVDLKKRNPNLKVLISMGGWNEGSEKYSKVMRDPTKRRRLVNNIHTFLLQWGFDGFDFDWEYPTKRGGIVSDAKSYVDFLRELRTKLGNHFLMTAAVGADPSYIGSSYIVSELNRHLDYINLMTYDYNSHHNGQTGVNSPLFNSPNSSNPQQNIDATTNLWIQSGASPSKLLIGLGFYGQSFTLSDERINGLSSATKGPGNPGPYSQQAGFLSYLEICMELRTHAWITHFDSQSRTPYAIKRDQWITFDNPLSIQMKTEYAVMKRLAGVMVWTVDFDDKANLCGQGRNPLLNSIRSVLKV